MTHTARTSTSPTAVRDAAKPNSARRHAIRESAADACMTCGLPVCWSSDTDPQHAGAAQVGHVVAASIGGRWVGGNLGAQCRDCNYAARDAGVWDLTPYVIPNYVINVILPTRLTTADDRRDRPATRYLPGSKARANAREQRGLPF